MKRRIFLKESALGIGALSIFNYSSFGRTSPDYGINDPTSKGPLAIAMWDFSWLERRWLGAGYEDWDQALDELSISLLE